MRAPPAAGSAPERGAGTRSARAPQWRESERPHERERHASPVPARSTACARKLHTARHVARNVVPGCICRSMRHLKARARKKERPVFARTPKAVQESNAAAGWFEQRARRSAVAQRARIVKDTCARAANGCAARKFNTFQRQRDGGARTASNITYTGSDCSDLQRKAAQSARLSPSLSPKSCPGRGRRRGGRRAHCRARSKLKPREAGPAHTLWSCTERRPGTSIARGPASDSGL
mgnify:CR=1 FL=1